MKEFWIRNTSDRNVTLSDLQLIVPAGRDWNLLDSKHFSYTEDQLLRSQKEGSIFKKSNIIKVINKPPKITVTPGIYRSTEARLTKPRSIIKIEEKRYEELELSDEAHAQEFAALDE